MRTHADKAPNGNSTQERVLLLSSSNPPTIDGRIVVQAGARARPEAATRPRSSLVAALPLLGP